MCDILRKICLNVYRLAHSRRRALPASKALPRNACGGQEARLELQPSVPPADAWFGVSDLAPRLGYLHMYNEMSGEQAPLVTSLVLWWNTRQRFILATLGVEALVASEADGRKQSRTVALNPASTRDPGSPATPPAWGLP